MIASPSENEEFEQGIVFYMSQDEPELEKVVGVVTWNLFGKMGIARKVCSTIFQYKQGQIQCSVCLHLFEL